MSSRSDWDEFTAIATGALAVLTGLLVIAAIIAAVIGWRGLSTAKEDLQATQRAAREALEASEEPFVIAVATDDPKAMKLRPKEVPPIGRLPPLAIHRAPGKDDEGAFVRLRLWNIGQGPAIVTGVSLCRGEEQLLDDLSEFHPLAIGHVADVEVRSPRWLQSEGAGTLTVTYTHASGRRYKTSQEVTIDVGEGDRYPVVQSVTYERSRVISESEKPA